MTEEAKENRIPAMSLWHGTVLEVNETHAKVRWPDKVEHLNNGSKSTQRIWTEKLEHIKPVDLS